MPHSPSPGDTPKRKHFPRLRPEQPPANPDICSFARPSLCGFRARFFLPSPRLSKIDHFTGGTGRQTPSIPPPTCTLKRTNSHAGPTAKDPALLTEVEGGGCVEGGGMTKTTACVGEHCLRLRREIFSGKTGFYTQWSWVWRKGAHIKRSALMCA